MKKLSRDEMKNVVGGKKEAPALDCALQNCGNCYVGCQCKSGTTSCETK